MTNQNWLAPQVVPSGTISSRAIEPLLLTLPARTKYKKDKIGFGVKSTHRFAEDSPYTFIGFDFNGQEAQVASMFAQAYHGGESGSDEFDKANLIGDKDNGTDFHSVSAKAAGIPRDIAKNVNYGLLYGAGLKTAANTVKQGLSESEKSKAQVFAKAALASFKGTKNRFTDLYEGGVASNYFNYVYNKSATHSPTLDVFGQTIPKSLDVAYIGRSGSPAQINFQIQAACATNGMLSAFLIFAFEEFKNADITDIRFSAAIHDEVHFICLDSQTELVAKCIVRAHCSVWALLSSRLGIPDLPVQRTIFDIVIDVSKCLRKEAFDKIDTPDFKYDKIGYKYYVSRETGKLAKRTTK